MFGVESGDMNFGVMAHISGWATNKNAGQAHLHTLLRQYRYPPLVTILSLAIIEREAASMKRLHTLCSLIINIYIF